MSDPRIGTDAAEVLPGSFGADLILGLGGTDAIDGNAGSDTLSGNAGLDTVNGGLDNDFILGGRDTDILRGDEGNDTIFGNKGSDSIFGGVDNDVIFGGQDGDTIDAGSGNDLIWGDLGADTLIGGTGADTFILTGRSGGQTLLEADTIVDFTPGLDRIGVTEDIDINNLNVTFQPLAGSATTVNVIVQDLVSGQILAKLDSLNRTQFVSNDIFTQVIAPSDSVDINEVPPSTTTPTTSDDSSSTDRTTPSVGKSASVTGNSTIVTFENIDYTFSSSDFSFFDADSDPFTSVRIASVPARGSLTLASTTTDATTGVSTTTTNTVTAGTDVPVGSLSSLKFVPEPNTQASPYTTFTFQVNDGDGLSNTGTAGIFVRDITELPVGTSNTLQPFIADTVTSITADEKIATTLTNTIAIVEDSGTLTGATIVISGGGTASTTREDELNATTLPSGIEQSYDAATRTLTLTGSAFASDYQTALRSVTYTNTEDFPQTDARTVSIVVNDGIQDSATQSYSLTVNDTPDNTSPVVGTTAPASSGSVGQLSASGDLTVATIVGAGTINVTDAQQTTSELGIAIFDASDAQGGAWQYDKAGVWTDVGAVSETNALVLQNTDKLRLNNPTTIGEATLSVRAWDTTDGLTGGSSANITTSGTGGTAAYSTATAAVKYDVITGASSQTLEAETDAILSTNTATTITTTAGTTAIPGTSGTYNKDGTRIRVDGSGGSEATATFGFPGDPSVSGNYDITVHYYDDNTSAPDVSLAINGLTLASWQFDYTLSQDVTRSKTTTGSPSVLGIAALGGVSISGGDVITFTGQRKGDDRSRLDKIVFDLV